MAAPTDQRATALIAAEISFAQRLAGNDVRLRARALKKLRKWLTSRGKTADGFTEADLMRIWKGLFFCMWMSDKPLVQEELAEQISNLVHCFTNDKTKFLFAKCFFRTMCAEWFGIDRLRLDKFLMLARRFLRQCFETLKSLDWEESALKGMLEVLSETVISANIQTPVAVRAPLGFQLHITDIILEELAKTGGPELDRSVIIAFVELFGHQLSVELDERFREHIIKRIFHHLMRQTDLGIEYEERQSRGEIVDPAEVLNGSDEWETDEEEEVGSEEEDIFYKEVNEAKDPRAGRVQVMLPQLQFDPTEVAAVLLEAGKAKAVPPKNRNVLYNLVKKFQDLAAGTYPLGISPSELLLTEEHEEGDVESAALKLCKLNKKMIKESGTIKLTKKEKRKQKGLEKKRLEATTLPGEPGGSSEDEDVEVAIQKGKTKLVKTNKDSRQREVTNVKAPTCNITHVKKKNEMKLGKNKQVLNGTSESKCETNTAQALSERTTNGMTNEDEALITPIVSLGKKRKNNAKIEEGAMKAKRKISSKENRELRDGTINNLDKQDGKNRKVNLQKGLTKLLRKSNSPSALNVSEIDSAVGNKQSGVKAVTTCTDQNNSSVSNSKCGTKTPTKTDKVANKKNGVFSKKSPSVSVDEPEATQKKGNKREKLFGGGSILKTPTKSVLITPVNKLPPSKPTPKLVRKKDLQIPESLVSTPTEMSKKDKRSKLSLKGMKTVSPLAKNLSSQDSAKSTVANTNRKNGLIGTTPSSNGKKKQQPWSVWDEPLMDGETEMVIPNKKYKGPIKLKVGSITVKSKPNVQITNSTNAADSKHNSSTHDISPFAHFNTVATPMPAFVRKKGKLSVGSTPHTNNKKVSFVLSRNMSQGAVDYWQSVRNSPDIPYSADKKPSQGVLKPFAASTPLARKRQKKNTKRLSLSSPVKSSPSILAKRNITGNKTRKQKRRSSTTF